MISITSTQTYGNIEAVITELNALPAFYREDIIEFKSYDGWRPRRFKFINGTFEDITYKPNGTAEEVSLNILHSVGGYYISNEGSKKEPNYHVWVPGITHATCDSAYSDISLAVCRCNFLAKNKSKIS